ncbi:MAG: hypothetical protein Ta2A_03420 [Treponemataceae bacterium]|nr:MAG: hypothetical protein Ta2A_03420 [Treponemataceae bacterium]
MFFSLTVSVFFALWTFLSFLNGTIEASPVAVESSELQSRLAAAFSAVPILQRFLTAFFSYNFFAVLFSVFALSFTMPVTMILIYIHFEKTQSQECVYFSAFLLACLAETVRIIIPIASLWDSNTMLLFACAKIIFFGRILAPLSFVFFVLSTAIGQTSESGSHFFVLLLLSSVFALIIPVNTLHVLPACTVEFGFSRVFDVTKIVFFVLTAIAFFLNAREKLHASAVLRAASHNPQFTTRRDSHNPPTEPASATRMLRHHQWQSLRKQTRCDTDVAVVSVAARQLVGARQQF